jgi:hypothetical protein
MQGGGMSQQLIEQASRLNKYLPIHNNGRTLAFNLTTGLPKTQTVIRQPKSTLVDILTTMVNEMHDLHPKIAERNVDELGHQLITVLLEQGG